MVKYEQRAANRQGASPEAIQAHYDVGNEFYRLWLDETMTYSSALWDRNDEPLKEAQERKLDYLIAAARAPKKHAVLDIGCGWGSCLKRMTQTHGVERAVGLTLSPAQLQWINELPGSKVQARLESWTDHRPDDPYDAIVSIGAFEHFVRPGHTSNERVETYRDFFRACRDMLKPGGWLALQTQAYSTVDYTEHSPLSQVFPESDMPRLFELAAGFDRLFQPDIIRNDAPHYARTVSCWLANLSAQREQAIAIAGEEVFHRFQRFLRGGVKGYEMGAFLLLRLSLRRID